MRRLLKQVLLNEKNVDILIEGDTITRITDRIEGADYDEIIPCADKIIAPSFANMHTHAAMMFLRGMGSDKPLHAWLEEDIWPFENRLQPTDIYALSRFAILEMIKTGTTVFCDMYGDALETARAVQDMGVRAMIPYVGMDLFQVSEKERRIKALHTFFEEQNNCPRVIKGVGCHAIYTTSKELIQRFYQEAQERDTYFHIHISETEKEITDCIAQHGCRPVELLEQWGVLGVKTILAHAVHLSDEEVALIARRKAVVAHCPTSNLKLNSGRMDFQKYHNASVHLTLGTDGVASNNSLSMLTEMKIAALSAKSVARSAKAGRATDIWQAATRNGFAALGIRAGVIAEGYQADFVLMNRNNVFLMPDTDRTANLVYAADSSCICDVFCAGNPIMTNGHVPGEEDIIAAFQETAKRLLIR